MCLLHGIEWTSLEVTVVNNVSRTTNDILLLRRRGLPDELVSRLEWSVNQLSEGDK